MRLLAITLIAAVSAIAIAQSASAQQRPTRDAAISQCVAMAQKAVPTIVDAADPNTNARLNIYKSCMRRIGYRA
ncbi:hypothetical protein QBC99_005978 [Beijerinckia sp. GAS462]|nr:hypothetical protein [Beijerinckia sp. GAS462]SED40442.1 hypothetical protein SAMN05443249_5286 [Beijerinckia sp. 28-YEA-48]